MKFIFSTLIVLSVFSATAFSQQINERDKGIALYLRGDYQAAVETLQKLAAAVKGKDQDLWLVIGMSFARLNNAKEAKKAFNKADKYSIKYLAGAEKEAKIISKPRPIYTDAGRMNNEQGKVKLAVELGAGGEINFIFPFDTLRYGLTEEAMAAAEKIRFEPAVKDGKNATTIAVVEYRFTLY
ncbi:MAG TPA: energy transducer TonB [Pyrinomonadaceae bacterium]|jgi:tetratricopeptide (TPR) repeat protein